MTALLAQPAGQREPVLARQTDIEQHQRRRLALDEPAEGSTAIGGADPKILPGEIIGEQLPLRRLVIDHDDMGPRVHCLPAGKPATTVALINSAAGRGRCPALLYLEWANRVG